MNNDNSYKSDGQFILSFELLQLLEWLIEHQPDEIKKLVHKALAQGLHSNIRQAEDLLEAYSPARSAITCKNSCTVDEIEVALLTILFTATVMRTTSIMDGNPYRISTVRIIAASTFPPRIAATVPHIVPTNTAMHAAKSPTQILIEPPTIHLANISLPSWSVPKIVK